MAMPVLSELVLPTAAVRPLMAAARRHSAAANGGDR